MSRAVQLRRMAAKRRRRAARFTRAFKQLGSVAYFGERAMRKLGAAVEGARA